MVMDNRVRAWLAELIGTFAIVFFGAGTVCAVRMPWLTCQPYTDVIAVALASSLALAVALTFTLNVSGGYLNPAVTLTTRHAAPQFGCVRQPCFFLRFAGRNRHRDGTGIPLHLCHLRHEH